MLLKKLEMVSIEAEVYDQGTLLSRPRIVSTWGIPAKLELHVDGEAACRLLLEITPLKQ